MWTTDSIKLRLLFSNLDAVFTKDLFSDYIDTYEMFICIHFQLYFHISTPNGTISTKMFDKRDDFDFDIVNFPFLDRDVPRRTSFGVLLLLLLLCCCC